VRVANYPAAKVLSFVRSVATPFPKHAARLFLAFDSVWCVKVNWTKSSRLIVATIVGAVRIANCVEMGLYVYASWSVSGNCLK